ncbi:aspartate:alanine exchanger family transporter [Roseibium album]|uniref:Aspartate/alanine antiporter n=1 Tax=Roseibium album TaxID=311410 RepID=A0A0M6Z9U1_9HYPH|nr:TrkA C-terminal domain-containing protein [Roseibium album]CTQ59538.1 Aspartate/alanine antiporter [Roseibium album]CTQ65339.1 Aspartate/alanine antiporter [Roseibium album]CTQ75279.1 Aspartate/alanine antiporter [Roseibium album]
MTIDFSSIFHQDSVLVIFTIIAIGYLIGNIRIARFEIGVTGGVLLCALLFGHYGYTIDPIVQSIGFTLFIYSVGWQAGPQILNVLRQDGPKYLVLTLFMTAGSFLLVLGLAWLTGLSNSFAAGLMAGSLTSTPTLVGAQNAVSSGLVSLPTGETANSLIESISVAYAITYIFGTVGLLLVVKLLPNLLRTDLAAAAETFANERGFKAENVEEKIERPILRAYELDDPGLNGMTIAEALAARTTKEISYKSLYRLKRGAALIDPQPETVIETGDKVAVFATPEEHAKARDLYGLGAEVLDRDLIDAVVDVAEVVVTNPMSVGKSLEQIGTYERHGCYLTRITRSQIQLPLAPGTVVQRGDVMILTGERRALDRAIAELGAEDRKAVETDLLTFAAGIVFGLMLGQITVKVGDINVGIGTAGGLLVAGICVGFLRANRPTFGRMPAAARFILMELGLLLFMVGVGLNAGGGIAEAIGSVGPVLFVSGVVVTCLPLLCGYAFGRLALGMNPALLLGALTGAMTSTPALGIVQQAAKSTVPALGYAGTYALANVLLTLAGTMIMLL